MIEENFDSLNSYASNTAAGGMIANNETTSGATVSGTAAATHLERMIESAPAFSDYLRLGLVSFKSGSLQLHLPTPETAANANATAGLDDASEYSSMIAGDDLGGASSPFRFCALNFNYQLCRTYPCVFVVPRDTSDECIRKNAKCHRQNRFNFFLSLCSHLLFDYMFIKISYLQLKITTSCLASSVD